MTPNVLLIVLDTARRDAVQPYSDDGVSTPAIADLARRGQAVEHAYATTNWTMPSHASMFTGLMPRRLGLAQMPEGGHPAIKATLQRHADRLLAPVLRRGGYETVGFSTNAWLATYNGFDTGFDSFEHVNSGRDERMNALVGQGWRAQLAWAREGMASGADDGAQEVGARLRRSIEAWSGTPTFWFVNLVECHSPYLPPRPWNDLPAIDRLRVALENKRHMSFESICLYVAGQHDVPAAAMQRMRHLYDRAVSYMDEWLGGILEALDARGILDDTLVIVTSDHGENFGEGRLLAHGFSLDERLIRVPLVLAGPGADIPGELFTLAETPRLIARAVGLERHPWEDDALPQGAVVAQYDPMGEPDDPRVQRYARRTGVSLEGVERLCARFTCATDGRLKLVLRNGVELLYDLTRDPLEQSPIDAADLTDGAPVEALRAALRHPAVTEAAAPEDAPEGAPDQASAEEMAEIERKMQLLGYM